MTQPLSDTDTNALKPCPFCGGEAIMANPHGAFSRLAAVYCETCEIKGPLTPTAEQAAAAWNTRGAEEALAAPTRHEGKLVEALTDARAALEIFGRCPPFGKSGIELFVIAQAIYDGSKRSATPREAYWHWDDFVAVKNAIERIDDALASTAGPK